jgi:DNA polymerase III delta prime subunit
MNHNEFLWTEKYRPNNLSECIIPKEIKNKLAQTLEGGSLMNYLLVGPPGVGKTTIARALCEQLDSDFLFINGSKERGIDVVRNDMQNFAATMSFKSGRKYIIVDEMDGMTRGTQNALKTFIEEHSLNCGFIYTSNHKNAIIEAIQSRCVVIDIRIPKDEKKELIVSTIKRMAEILKNENVKFEPKLLQEIVVKTFPDIRKCINALQQNSVSGALEIVALENKENIDQLIRFLKESNFTEVRNWVSSNYETDIHSLINDIYKKLNTILKPNSIPGVILAMNNHDYRDSFCVNKEINLLAMLTNIMVEAEFK